MRKIFNIFWAVHIEIEVDFYQLWSETIALVGRFHSICGQCIITLTLFTKAIYFYVYFVISWKSVSGEITSV